MNREVLLGNQNVRKSRMNRVELLDFRNKKKSGINNQFEMKSGMLETSSLTKINREKS
jgi:hypothetical protein